MPQELSQLTNLKLLILYNNNISSVPKELLQLKNLTVHRLYTTRTIPTTTFTTSSTTNEGDELKVETGIILLLLVYFVIYISYNNIS